jgi:peptidoglycan hydrolase FlgJ
MNIIQDYMNRANISDSKLNDLKRSMETPSKDSANSFKKELDEKLLGKISSADVINPSNIKEEIKKDPYRKKLFDASVEFESMFVKLMLNQMRKTVEKQNMIHGGYAEDIFEDMLYDEYAKEISKNESLGIAEQIYSSMAKSLPPIEDHSLKK